MPSGFWPIVRAGKGGITSADLTKQYGPGARLTIWCEVSALGNNDTQPPHFSVTGEVRIANKSDIQAGGCLHEEALRYWPECAHLFALHLSHATDGEPMHGEGNGWYNLAGFFQCGERYHRGNSDIHIGGQYRNPTPDECLRVFFSDHVRVSPDDACAIAERVRLAAIAADTPCELCGGKFLDAYGLLCANCTGDGRSSWRTRLRAAWRVECDAMRSRWAEEARAGVEWLLANAGPSDLVTEWRKRVAEHLPQHAAALEAGVA